VSFYLKYEVVSINRCLHQPSPSKNSSTINNSITSQSTEAPMQNVTKPVLNDPAQSVEVQNQNPEPETQAPTQKPAPKPTQAPTQKPTQAPTQPPAPRPTDPPKPRSPFEKPYDISALISYAQTYGSSIGMMWSESLTPDNCSWGAPITTSGFKTGETMKEMIRAGIDRTKRTQQQTGYQDGEYHYTQAPMNTAF